MHIVSIALGGCLKAEPVRYGITEDTGGHITYVLGEMHALAQHPAVSEAEIVTRLFSDPHFECIHSQPTESLGPNLRITRIDSGNRAYLAKEALAQDRAAFTAALIENLECRPRLPDLIHAHFADAADVAAKVEAALGIPFVYTAHSLGKDKLRCQITSTARDLARIAEETRAIEGAAAIIGSSRDECERQLPAYAPSAIGKIHRIAPGIAVRGEDKGSHEGASEVIAPFLRDPGRPMVLAIARAVHKKNLVGLVEAFGNSDSLRSACNLVILAGLRKGDEAAESEQAQVMRQVLDAIDRHDLYGTVAYPKTHARDDVDGLYRLAKESGGVFVNPALMEPYGLTLIEAASYGLPVVATKVGGPMDIVGELEHGCLVDPTDPDDIARGIESIVFDSERWQACSRNGQTNSRSMSWEAYAEGFVSIANSVCKPAEVVRSQKLNRLVVSDIDNTLTGCVAGAGRFSGFFTRQPGFGFAVATGRSLVEARRLIREWSLPDPLAWITSVGSELYLAKDGGPVLDTDYAEMIDEEWDPCAVDRLCCDIPGLKPQPHYEQRQFKRSYFTHTPDVAQLVQQRFAEADITVRIIFSHGNLLDILPHRAGKGAAMAFLACKLGIAPEHVFAVGDSGNDADMLAGCANAVLVGNHSDEVANLRQNPNVYVARRSHGAGALEGVLMQHRLRQQRRALAGAA